MSQPFPGRRVTRSCSLSSSIAAHGPREGPGSRSRSLTVVFLSRPTVERVDRVEHLVPLASVTQELPENVAAVVLDEQGTVIARPEVPGVEPRQRVLEIP